MARSIRARITLAATAAVAIVLVLGGILAVLTLRTSLLGGVEQLARADVSAIGARLDDDSGIELTADESDGDDRFVQLVSNGAVVAASDDLEGSGPLAIAESVSSALVDGDTYVVVAEQEDDVLIVAGRSTDEADQVVGALVPLVAGAVPVLVLLLGLTTWVVVGRALAPVERMRREVDAVTAEHLDRRVQQPRASDELGRLATTMNRMLDRLDESQRAQRRFISDASHELRSPLASLRQYAEVARDYPDRMTRDELVAAITDEGGRLEAIVRGMLVLARADESTLGATVDVDLDDLALAEAGRLRAAGALRVDSAGGASPLQVDSTGVGAARVRGDAGLLAQVLRNLADNAARHAVSRIAFSTVMSGAAVVLTVDDDGAGIPEADRERVFERFVRLDESRSRDAGGSGLGLAIVREIVRAHGGTVTAAASPLGGARVVVTLPS